MEKRPNVLVTFIESGIGHITPAEAISDSLKKKYEDKFNIIEDYIMHGNKVTENFENFLVKQVKNTNFLRGTGNIIFALFEIIGRHKFFMFIHKTLFAKQTRETIKQMQKHNPDVVVVTHYFLTHCAIEYKRLYKNDLVIITYNPDINTHVWWDNRDGLFLVNNNIAKEEALGRRKFKPENIRQINFPIRDSLRYSNMNKAEFRNKYDIPQDKFCVIVADSAYAMGKSKKFTKQLLKTDREITILYIAGKNKKRYDYMIKRKEQLKQQGRTNITLKVYPFQKDIHELYAASDLFITKGGINSILDSVYMGTPVIVNFCPQPMEKAANKYFVKLENCGKSIFNAYKNRKVVEQIIDNPDMLNQYLENVAKFKGAESGSDMIADIIAEETNIKK